MRTAARHTDRAAQGRADSRRPRRRLARTPRSRGRSAGAAAARARTWRSTSPSIAARPDIGAVVHAHLPGRDGADPRRRGPGPGRAARDGAASCRACRSSRSEIPGSDELAGRIAAALSEPPEPLAARGPARAPRRGRGRSRPGPCGRPARARRGALPNVARCTFDSRGAGSHSVWWTCRSPAQVATRGGTMNARKYLAELLGTFLFMMVGYMSVAGLPCRRAARAGPPGRAVLVRPRPAGRDLRVRAHLRRPLQPGRDGRDGARPPHDRRSKASATSSPRSSAPSPRPSSSC